MNSQVKLHTDIVQQNAITLTDSIPTRILVREQNKKTLFGGGMGMSEAFETSIASLNAHARKYPHWILTYSGGKDSSATLTFVLYALEHKLIPPPQSLTVLYADTGMELTPLHITALETLKQIRGMGYNGLHVIPRYTERFFVNLLGRGLPPPRLKTRWCTRMMKQQPMGRAAERLQRQYGEDSVLFITGVRMGESDARDERITASCSTDDGECGQGWFQQKRHALAPLLHWRSCWVWKWLYAEENPLPVVRGINPAYDADRYGSIDIRTGCFGCVLVNEDLALKYLIRKPGYEHLTPLMELKALYEEMRKPEYRHRRGMYLKKDGTYSASMSQSLGPLTITARKLFFGKIKSIQDRSGIEIITVREEVLIRRMWRWRMYPQGWTGNEPLATAPYSKPLFTKKVTDKSGRVIIPAKYIGEQPYMF